MSKADGSIIIDTKIDQTGLEKGLNMMKNTAIAGAAAIAASITALSVAVVGLGSDFEQANAKASTLFGDAQVDMMQYQGKMLDLSSKTGLAATDLGNTMYDALSAGIPASDDMSDAIGYLGKNTKLAKAGFTDINTATTATAKVLNAYKMDVGETDRVHKVLMATQNRGITTVNELGSVLSQVTPTASAMNVSFEQVGASLANMTAQGTPTAQATTQLNQLFAELGKKGTIGQEGLEKAVAGTKHAGKSFQDLMKEGVPLNEILDLMGTYAEENGISLLDMFSSLDGGKAALAISGQNAEQFTSNLKEMSTEVDLVGDAYDKVTDTFKEKSEKVVNSLKNVGIKAYSKFEVPLKGAMDSAQKSVDSLSREMSSGKLSKSVDTIADGFGDLISAGVDLASDVLPMLIKGFAFVVDNGKALTAILAGVAAATIYNNNVDKISIAIKTATTAGTVLYATAQNVLAGSLTVAEGAQMALNVAMGANPIGLVVIAVGALTAGIAALCLSMDDNLANIKEEQKAFEERKKSYDEELSSKLAQIDNTKRLSEELKNLVGANGEVDDANKGRVSFILGTLNDAMGTEYELVDGVIQKYDELSSSIDNAIDKIRAEAIVESQKKAYTDALDVIETTSADMQEVENSYTNTKELNAIKIADLEKQKAEALDKGRIDEAKRCDDKIADLDRVTEMSKRKYDETLESLNMYLSTKNLWEENSKALQEGRYNDIKNIVVGMTKEEGEAVLFTKKQNFNELSLQYDSYVKQGDEARAEATAKLISDSVSEGIELAKTQGINNDTDLLILDGFIATKQSKIAELTAAQKIEYNQQRQDEIDILNGQVGDGLRVYSDYVANKVAKATELTNALNEDSTQQQKDAAIAARQQAYDTLAVYSQNVQDKITSAQYLRSQLGVEGSGVTEDMVLAAEDQAKKATEEYDKVAENTLKSLNSKEADIAGIGTNYTEGFITGVKSLSGKVSEAGRWIGELAANGLKAFGIVKSPSRLMRGIGVHYGEGFVLGIEDEEKNVSDAAKSIAEVAVDEVSAHKIDMQDALDFDLKGAIDMMPDSEVNKIAERLNKEFIKISTAIPPNIKVSVEEELQKVKLLFGNVKNDNDSKKPVTIHQTVQFMNKTESPAETYRALQRANKKMAEIY